MMYCRCCSCSISLLVKVTVDTPVAALLNNDVYKSSQPADEEDNTGRDKYPNNIDNLLKLIEWVKNNY